MTMGLIGKFEEHIGTFLTRDFVHGRSVGTSEAQLETEAPVNPGLGIGWVDRIIHFLPQLHVKMLYFTSYHVMSLSVVSNEM